MASVTVIVPAYNEVDVVEKTLRDLAAALQADTDNDYHIIAVDDGSTDGTGDALAPLAGELGITVLANDANLGYGASIKRGLAESEGDVVVTFDADGQHRADDVPQLVRALDGHDAAIGARSGIQGCPLWRVPGRWLLARLVDWLCGRRIPDFNCGLRAVRRDTLARIQRLCSDAFSFSATSTMALYGTKARITFVPIEVADRTGRSSVSAVTGVQALVLALRSIMVFNPLRVFLPLAGVLGLLGLGFLVHGLATSNITDVCILLMLSALQLLLIGLVADQVALIRREGR